MTDERLGDPPVLLSLSLMKNPFGPLSQARGPPVLPVSATAEGGAASVVAPVHVR